MTIAGSMPSALRPRAACRSNTPRNEYRRNSPCKLRKTASPSLLGPTRASASRSPASLARKGITFGARDRGRGQSAVAELGSKGFAARFVQIDLTKLDTMVGAAADIEAQEGRLDILINNAGIRRCVCAIRAMQTIHRSSRTLRFYNRLRHGPR